MLDENASLIKTISEYQNVGKHTETVQYQWSLHRNLMYLASVADSNQNIQNLFLLKSSYLWNLYDFFSNNFWRFLFESDTEVRYIKFLWGLYRYRTVLLWCSEIFLNLVELTKDMVLSNLLILCSNFFLVFFPDVRWKCVPY